MSASLLNEEALKAATGAKRRGDLARYLSRAGVPFQRGAGGAIWTSLDAINAALGLRTSAPEPAPSTEIEVL
jgi:hypothetical protein